MITAAYVHLISCSKIFMGTLLLIILMMNVIFNVNGTINLKLVDAYFKEKMVSFGVIIGCFSKSGTLV